MATTDAPAEPEAEEEERERGPLRRCAVTRERLPRESMVRFVLAPDRAVVPDLGARLPGRGIWLSARADVLNHARLRGAFARAARGAVTLPADLLPGLISALQRRIGDHLGLARRAGQAVGGFDRARDWLVAGRAGLIVQAADGSADERARLLGVRAASVPVIRPVDATRLGAIFGRERTVHVAVAAGRLANGLVADAGRLAGLRGDEIERTDTACPGQTTGRPSGMAARTTQRDQADR